MIQKIVCAFSVVIVFTSCGKKENKLTEQETAPIIKDKGMSILFPDKKGIDFFKTETISTNAITAQFSAPAKIAATVLPSGEGALQPVVLFDNSELAASYTQLMQSRISISQIQNINIKQKRSELERTKDLNRHGAATGQDLLNAQTALSIEQTSLANEKAALIEHESRLISAGFTPDMLRNAKVGTAYLICDIPENQISKVKPGSTGDISFNSFPNETFKGRIDAIVDRVDLETRMVKIRISVHNPSNKLKSGMFASVSFGLKEGNFISISKTSLVTVNGKNYVFVKESENNFKRREIQTGQQVGDRIIVFKGLNSNGLVVVEGVMQLKGLSFGY
ncbi:efflux RND transporter periplasmic adaptor subunit [Flavobacterium tructae]|uniref:efflux RND transporter periplasmic adaptor subunit n=1 Tax=Flavobacterium tructae TaxID=1114873 RepID=UPI002551E51D|nr:efflux RND transporter periplasmic adaptor subunit [Flavobacterium tructae]MDL2141611.1 efflux RND transporter periplasmic adaptor subunit [Flavobacterium tructae]